jgi:adenylate cyclase
MKRLLAWIGPQAARTGRGLQLRTRILLTLTLSIAGVFAATGIFVLANFIVSTESVEDASEVRLVNVIAYGAYLLGAVIVGAIIGNKKLRPFRSFLTEEREPTPEERRMVLRAPLVVAKVNGAMWAGAVVLFGVLNTTYSLELGVNAAVTCVLGGVTTSAFSYLLSERLLRAAAARAMATGAPERLVGPGVAARSIIFWALGTGVPLFGLILVALGVLTGDDVTERELAIVIITLCGLALIVGLIVSILAAHATADPITSVRNALARVERGELDAEVPVYDGSEVGLLQAGFNRMVAGLRERERIRETLGTYVDPEVAEHILSEDSSPEGEEVEVTLMFLDVRDFTRFAESAPPQEVVSTLNRLFEIAVPIVRRHGGHVDKFVGDGFLAVFGAPQPAEDHAERALAAACEIAGAVKEELGDRIRAGIGLNSGPVVAGSIGGAGRLEFSVIGDAVNVAARVEAATRETGDAVLLSEETAALLNGSDGLEPRPGIGLKGKADPVTLYAPRE